MNLVRTVMLALGLALGGQHALAQTNVTQPYNTGQATYTLNSGPDSAWFNYYDAGGPSANYLGSSSWSSSVVTFVSAPGTTIDVQFSAFDLESGWDGLYVYDGATTSAPKIASINGESVCGGAVAGPGGWWGSGAPGNAGPGLIRSSGNAITFAFCSDASVSLPGWAAQVRTTESLSLTKTVGTQAGVCAATDTLAVSAGTTVYYCYTVTNTGSSTLNPHTLVDDQVGTIFNALNLPLAPGASANTVAMGISVPAVINSTTTNTATWTAGAASATASATVTVANYNVTANVNDPAGGSVVCVPATVPAGGSSTCTATANAGFGFTGWAGDCSGSNPVCTLTSVSADRTVTANFARAAVQPVPTLESWGLMLLSGLLGWLAVRRRAA